MLKCKFSVTSTTTTSICGTEIAPSKDVTKRLLKVFPISILLTSQKLKNIAISFILFFSHLSISEAPAPGLDEGLRKQMGEAAVNSARAVQYNGAGTVEFILDREVFFSFLFFSFLFFSFFFFFFFFFFFSFFSFLPIYS